MLTISPGTTLQDRQVAPGPCAVPGGLICESGKLVGICGESGVGKSVFLRLLVDVLQGAARMQGGAVTINGGVKYVPQDLGLLREQSLVANARFISGVREIEVAIRYAPQGMRRRFMERRSWSPATLSGGERRMFVLSSALAAGREVVIVDEILVSMDRSLADSALMAIRTWLAEAPGRACLVVSHDPFVLSLCDAVYHSRRIGYGSEVHLAAEAFRRTAVEETRYESTAVADVDATVANSVYAQAIRIRWLGRLVMGSAIAIVAVLLLFHVSRWFVPAASQAFVPSVIKIVQALPPKSSVILMEGGWTIMTSVLALIVSILLCVGYWLVVLNTKGETRGILNSVLVGMQAIPVLVLAPLVGVLFGVESMLVLEVLIGVFIAVFPLCLMGARQLVSVPEDMYRAAGARRGWGKLKVAVKTEWGALVRAGIACAPLAAVGVVVGEYVAGRRGVGNLVFRSITSGADFADRWSYAIACVGVATVVLMIAGGVGAALLPKDVAPE